MTPGLRTYSLEDRDQCLRVFDSNRPRYFAGHERAQFVSYLDKPGFPYFVVERSGVIVGCGGYAIAGAGKPADLCWGMIDNTCHRERLGEFLLLGRLQAIVGSDPVDAVRLATSQFTEGFFSRFGFSVISRATGGFGEGLDKVEMRLDLTGAVRERILRGWHNAAGDKGGPCASS